MSGFEKKSSATKNDLDSKSKGSAPFSSSLPVNETDQSYADKKSLMEFLRSERMQRIGKYLGWLSGS